MKSEPNFSLERGLRRLGNGITRVRDSHAGVLARAWAAGQIVRLARSRHNL